MRPVSGEPWGQRYHEGGLRALYLHVPFCLSKCAYCDFPSWATRRGDPLMGGYARALAAQVGALSDAGLLERCETAYLGGGTPTLLGAGCLAGLVGAAAACSGQVGELSFEANPEFLTEEALARAREAGATRVSIGAQSLDDGELRGLGRVHDAEVARRAVGLAVASGLDVSCDLMCAIPRQTDASWGRTLAGALSLGIGHASVYPLQIEEGTALGRRYAGQDPDFDDPDVQAARMEAAERAMGRAGLVRYEVASYALPGRECRHNLAYWTGLPYAGLGTGAAAMLTAEGYARLRESCCPQLPKLFPRTSRARLRVETGRSEMAGLAGLADGGLSRLDFEVEELTFREALAEDLMLGARLTRGLDPGLVAEAREAMGARLDEALGGCVARGLLTERGGHLAPTERGWLLGNELYGALWDLADEG